MIQNIRHKGLRLLWEDGATGKFPPELITKIEQRLEFIDTVTQIPQDFGAFPGWKIHKLSGNLKGFWSIRVSGNYRIIFKWDGQNVYDVDYLDYH